LDGSGGYSGLIRRITLVLNTYIALLRAVNVGGTGKLPMAELKATCIALGFTQGQTYIASGNVVFKSALSESKVKARLEAKPQTYAGKPVGVHSESSTSITDKAWLKAN
jgi:uncharacterized protein (DUF1697 family)